MLSELYSDGVNLELLTEANLINTKQVFNNVSLVGYLKTIAAVLPSPELQKQYITKIGKLLVNDSRYHVAVRELPHDAPEWAAKAVADRSLYAFVPNEQLTDTLNNTVHYLAACVTASATDDNNEVVVAKKELQGFQKVGSIDDLNKKANDYFKRGTKSAQGSIEGMDHLDTTGDYEWYILTNQAAYAREGKVLQNCIGKAVTYDRCQAKGESIVVMKTKGGNTVVGAQLHNDSHTIIEMKGKNNQPPVSKYANAVVQFVNDHELKLDGAAVRDFVRSGYHWIDGRLYTYPDVIKSFVKQQKIHSDGDMRLNQLQFTSGEARASYLAGKPFFVKTNNPNDVKIYRCSAGGAVVELIALDTELVIAELISGVPITIQSGLVSAINWLIDNKHHVVSDSSRNIGGLTPSLMKELFATFTIAVIVDSKTGKQSVELSKPRDVITNDDTTTEVHAVNGDKKVSYRAWSSGHATRAGHDDKERHPVLPEDTADGEEVALVRRNHDKAANNDLALRIHDGVLYPYAPHTHGDKHPKSSAGTNKPDERNDADIKAIIDTANAKGVDIDGGFKIWHGIVTTSSGKHKVADVHPTKIKDGVKFDLTTYDTQSRAAVANMISMSKKIRTPGDSGDVVGSALHFGHSDHNDMLFKNTAHIRVWPAKQRQALLGYGKSSINTSRSGADTFDTIYMIDVTYGDNEKHRVAVMAKGDQIVSIDDATISHPFKDWTDHQNVAEQLNAAFKKHNLKLPRSGIFKGRVSEKDRDSGMVDSMEFRHGSNGEITTATNITNNKTAKLVDTLAGADQQELKFADGATLAPMKHDQIFNFYRKELKIDIVPGIPWVLRDSKGIEKSVIVVKDNKVITTYRKPPGRDDQPYERSVYSPDVHSYIKTAKRELKWTESTRLKKFQNERHNETSTNKSHTILHSLTTASKHSFELRFEPDDNGELYATKFEDESDRWRKALTDTSIDTYRNLEHAGLINFERQPGGDDNVYNVGATQKGIKFQWSYEHSEKDELIDGIPAHTDSKHKTSNDESESGKNKNTKSPSNDDTQASTKKPKAGTKAALALDKYIELAKDNNHLPTRGEFIEVLMGEPFNMSKASASTYHHNTKKKYAQLNETFSVLAGLELMVEEMRDTTPTRSLLTYLRQGA